MLLAMVDDVATSYSAMLRNQMLVIVILLLGTDRLELRNGSLFAALEQDSKSLLAAAPYTVNLFR